MYYLVAICLKIILFMILTQAKQSPLVLFVVSAGVTTILYTFLYNFFNRKKDVIAFGFYVFLSVLMFVDVVYFTYFNRLISIRIHSQIFQLNGVLNVISFLVSLRVLLLIIDLPILLFILLKRKSFEMKPVIVHHFGRTILLLSTLVGILIHSNLDTIKAYEFFTYHVSDVVENILDDNKQITSLHPQSYYSLLNYNRRKLNDFTSVAKDKNLIVIQVEALQKLAINLKVQGKEITPNLNSLISNDTLYFSDIFQSVGRGNTSDAELATLTSLIPSEEEISFETYDQNTFYSLVHALKEVGYQSSYFHSNDSTFYNRENMIHTLGFDKQYDAQDYYGDVFSFGVNDIDFYSQSIKYIQQMDRQNQKWMSMLVSVSSHTPFELEDSMKTLKLENPTNDLVLNYFEALHYADAALGRFIHELKTANLYDDSVIVIYGDHFGVNAQQEELSASMSRILGEGYSVDKMLNVPLLIHIPGLGKAQQFNITGSQLDIFPTLLNLFGLENQKSIMFGRDLFSYSNKTAIINYFQNTGSFIDSDVVFLASRDDDYQKGEFINRKTGEILANIQLENKVKEVKRLTELSQQILTNDLMRPYILK